MDIYSDYDLDLNLTTNGDFVPVNGSTLTYQRIIRRLMTNPGTYKWHPDYGAGLGAYVGKPMTQSTFDEIKGKIRSQMFMEKTVSKSKPPQITVQQASGNLGGIYVYIVYYDQALNEPFTLSFTVGPN